MLTSTNRPCCPVTAGTCSSCIAPKDPTAGSRDSEPWRSLRRSPGHSPSRVDRFIVDVRVVATQPSHLLRQPALRVSHELAVAPVPQLVAVGERPGYAAAVGLVRMLRRATWTRPSQRPRIARTFSGQPGNSPPGAEPPSEADARATRAGVVAVLPAPYRCRSVTLRIVVSFFAAPGLVLRYFCADSTIWSMATPSSRV